MTIPFPRKVKTPKTPDPRIIDLCQSLLAQAEHGDLQALAVAVVYADDLRPDGECNSGWVAGSGCYFALTHAIHKLSRAWGRYCDDIPEAASSAPPSPSA